MSPKKKHPQQNNIGSIIKFTKLIISNGDIVESKQTSFGKLNESLFK
jgi:hypothetical protein